MKVTLTMELTDEHLQAIHYHLLTDRCDKVGLPVTDDVAGEREAVDDFLRPAIAHHLWVAMSRYRYEKYVKSGEPRRILTAPREGSHDCPESPTGRCWFSLVGDPNMDACVYCGKPEKRT